LAKKEEDAVEDVDDDDNDNDDDNDVDGLVWFGSRRGSHSAINLPEHKS